MGVAEDSIWWLTMARSRHFGLCVDADHRSATVGQNTITLLNLSPYDIHSHTIPSHNHFNNVRLDIDRCMLRSMKINL